VDPSRELLAAERPRGVFSRQLVLGNNLDTGRITADYRDGVLRLVIPVAEKAKPRKITVGRPDAAKATNETRVITEDGEQVHGGTAAKEPVSV
jgi:HSP20 family protein